MVAAMRRNQWTHFQKRRIAYGIHHPTTPAGEGSHPC